MRDRLAALWPIPTPRSPCAGGAGGPGRAERPSPRPRARDPRRGTDGSKNSELLRRIEELLAGEESEVGRDVKSLFVRVLNESGVIVGCLPRDPLQGENPMKRILIVASLAACRPDPEHRGRRGEGPADGYEGEGAVGPDRPVAGHQQQHGRPDRAGEEPALERRQRVHPRQAQTAGRPSIEVALYEYGNDNLPAQEGFVRLVLPMTDDLDAVSEKLFALKTRGGQEYLRPGHPRRRRPAHLEPVGRRLQGDLHRGQRAVLPGTGRLPRCPAARRSRRGSSSTRSSAARPRGRADRLEGRRRAGRRPLHEHRPGPQGRRDPRAAGQRDRPARAAS